MTASSIAQTGTVPSKTQPCPQGAPSAEGEEETNGVSGHSAMGAAVLTTDTHCGPTLCRGFTYAILVVLTVTQGLLKMDVWTTYPRGGACQSADS